MQSIKRASVDLAHLTEHLLESACCLLVKVRAICVFASDFKEAQEAKVFFAGIGFL